MQAENTNHQKSLGLEIDEISKTNLTLVAHWAKILSIGIFIIIGIGFIALLMLFFSNSLFGNFFPFANQNIFDGGNNYIIILLFVIVIICVLLFIYTSFLFRFSKKLTNGLNNNDSFEITEGFSHLKTYLIITGVFSILGLLGSIFSIIAN